MAGRSMSTFVSGGKDTTVRCWNGRIAEIKEFLLLAIGYRVLAMDADENGKVIVGLNEGIVLFEISDRA